MSHTPGPWKVNPKTVRDGVYAVLLGKTRLVYVEGADDARLISAAPDLLAACRFALSQMEAAGLLYGDVRNAIAKATGEKVPA